MSAVPRKHRSTSSSRHEPEIHAPTTNLSDILRHSASISTEHTLSNAHNHHGRDTMIRNELLRLLGMILFAALAIAAALFIVAHLGVSGNAIAG